MEEKAKFKLNYQGPGFEPLRIKFVAGEIQDGFDEKTAGIIRNSAIFKAGIITEIIN